MSELIGSNELPDLASRINAAHAEAVEGTKTAAEALHRAVDRCVEAGKLLIEAKARVGYGGWGKWVEENLTFSRQQAHKYIRVAGHRGEVVNSSFPVTSLNQMVALLTAPVSKDEGEVPEAPATVLKEGKRLRRSRTKKHDPASKIVAGVERIPEFDPDQVAANCQDPEELREQIFPAYERLGLLVGALDNRIPPEFRRRRIQPHLRRDDEA